MIKPVFKLVADKEPVVTAPETDAVAARSRPVTLTAFATKPPKTVDVDDADAPITTVSEVGPTRTVPVLKPVPASSTKSPPVLAMSPAA